MITMQEMGLPQEFEELRNVDETVLNAFCIHQNQKLCNRIKGSPNADISLDNE